MPAFSINVSDLSPLHFPTADLNVTTYQRFVSQTATSALVKMNHTLTTRSPTQRPSKDNNSRDPSQLLHLSKQSLSLSTPLQCVCVCVHDYADVVLRPKAAKALLQL